MITEEELISALKEHYRKVYTHIHDGKDAISYQYIEKMLPIIICELLADIKQLLSDRDNKAN